MLPKQLQVRLAQIGSELSNFVWSRLLGVLCCMTALLIGCSLVGCPATEHCVLSVQVLAMSRIMVAWQPVGIATGIYDMCNR